MKFNIKALLVGAALILGAQGSISAMWVEATNEGLKFEAWPQFTSTKGIYYGGKFMPYGWVMQGGTKFPAVARINPDGTADRSFGVNGVAIITGAPNEQARDLRKNDDGTFYLNLTAPGNASAAAHLSAEGKQIEGMLE